MEGERGERFGVPLPRGGELTFVTDDAGGQVPEQLNAFVDADGEQLGVWATERKPGSRCS